MTPPELRRRVAGLPGAARTGWILFGFGLLFVWLTAFVVLDPNQRASASFDGAALFFGVGFGSVVIGWRAARERRPLGVLRWASKAINAPGLAESWRLRTTLPPAPPAPRDPERARAESRNAALGVATGLAWLCSSIVAIFGVIRWFPPRVTVGVLSLGVSVATAAGAIASAAFRRSSAWRRVVPAGLALVLPIASVVVVPGLGRLGTTPLPGHIDMATTARRDGPSDLFLILDGGRTVTKLTDTGTPTGGAGLSPDERHIAFGDDRAGTLDLWIMDLDDALRPVGVRRLTDSLGDEEFPVWSPDGRRLAYIEVTETTSDVRVIDVATGEITAITDDGDSFSPSWSPEGSSLVYSSAPAHAPTNYDIWRVRADGSNPRDILDSGDDDYDPHVSPDARSLLFSSDGSGSFDVWVADLDGGHARPLTLGEPATDRAVGWSPDGRYAIFASDRSHTGGNFLYFVPVGGGAATLGVVI